MCFAFVLRGSGLKTVHPNFIFSFIISVRLWAEIGASLLNLLL